MERSASIIELIQALVKAQAEFQPAKKSATNPLFESSYATLDDVIMSVKDILAKNGLCVIQPLSTTENGFVLETILIHISGEWTGTQITIPLLGTNRGTNALQAFGSSLTYTRRYMLASLLCLSSEDDDDGNESGQTTIKQKKTAPKKTAQSSSLATEKQRNAIKAKFRKLGIWSEENIDKQLKEQGFPPLAQTTKTDASKLFERLDKAIKAKEENDTNPAPLKGPTEEQEPPQEEPVITDENPNGPIIEEDPPF